MKMAAEAGLAPRVWYTSIEDQISITDFVEEAPFRQPKRWFGCPRCCGPCIHYRRFPKECIPWTPHACSFMHKGPAVDGFIRKFQEAKILSKGECEELFRWHAQLSAVYPHHEPDMVSSHNDLFKPDNILFDGHRVWLVDWEAAFLNDRYADLAVVANQIVSNDAEERLYLQEYFGQPPDPYQLARFFLMQQVVHMFYAMAFLFIGSSGEPLDQSEKAPQFNAFQRRMWTGEVNLKDKDMKMVYGRIHWERLIQNMRQPRLNEALRIVSDRHASPWSFNSPAVLN